MKRFLPLGSHGMPLHPSSCLAVKHHHLLVENIEMKIALTGKVRQRHLLPKVLVAKTGKVLTVCRF